MSDQTAPGQDLNERLMAIEMAVGLMAKVAMPGLKAADMERDFIGGLRHAAPDTAEGREALALMERVTRRAIDILTRGNG